MKNAQDAYSQRSINPAAMSAGEVYGSNSAARQSRLCESSTKQPSAPTSVGRPAAIGVLFGRESDCTVVTGLGDPRTGQVDVNDGEGEAASLQRVHHDVVLMISDLDQARHSEFQRKANTTGNSLCAFSEAGNERLGSGWYLSVENR